MTRRAHLPLLGTPAEVEASNLRDTVALLSRRCEEAMGELTAERRVVERLNAHIGMLEAHWAEQYDLGREAGVAAGMVEREHMQASLDRMAEERNRAEAEHYRLHAALEEIAAMSAEEAETQAARVARAGLEVKP